MARSLRYLFGPKKFAVIVCCSVAVTTGVLLYIVSLLIFTSSAAMTKDTSSLHGIKMTGSHEIAVCTIASRNYIGRVRAFFSSLYAHQPNVTAIMLLVDKNDGYIQAHMESFVLVELEQLHIPQTREMLLRYEQMEANTAFKAALLIYVLESLGFKKVAYFDPDIWITASIDPLWTLLDYYSVVLTPHIVEPYPEDEFHPTEIDILRAGTMNLGFLGLRNTELVLQLLRWWHHRLVFGAHVDMDRGYHFDQHWIDLATSFISDIYVVRDKRYNVAYWNLHERGAFISLDKSGTCCVLHQRGQSPERVVFFHFSGLQLDDIDSVSKHSRRYKLSRHFPQLVPVYEHYIKFYKSMIPDGSLAIPYAYDYSQDGTPIHPISRLLYREMYPKIPKGEDPFAAILWIGRERVTAQTRVSRFLHQLWKTRGDLQALFPDPLGRDGERYITWFEQLGRKELKVSEKTLPRMEKR